MDDETNIRPTLSGRDKRTGRDEPKGRFLPGNGHVKVRAYIAFDD
jgi:hypothetical protein